MACGVQAWGAGSPPITLGLGWGPPHSAWREKELAWGLGWAGVRLMGANARAWLWARNWLRWRQGWDRMGKAGEGPRPAQPPLPFSLLSSTVSPLFFSPSPPHLWFLPSPFISSFLSFWAVSFVSLSLPFILFHVCSTLHLQFFSCSLLSHRLYNSF